MSTASIIEVLTQSGIQRETECLNLHTARFNEDFSDPGIDYVNETLWNTGAATSLDTPSFVRYALDPKEMRDSTHVRCFALRIDPPFMGLSNARAWLNPMSVPGGWTLEVSINASWEQHLQRFLPIEHFFSASMANLMPGYDTRLDESEMTISTSHLASLDNSSFVSNWVSVRASVGDSASPGPLLGESGGLANPMVWNFSWLEL